MQEESKRNAILVETFTKGFLCKTKLPCLEIKKAHGVCRKAIENKLLENSDIKEIIGNNEWIKELIVNYTLLRTHFHGVFGEMDYAHRKETKIDKKQYINWGGL